MLITFVSLPAFFSLMQNWTLKTARTLPIQFVVEEVRAFESQMVVTKVMYCDDLLYAGGKPNHQLARMGKKI
jgi:hypothetical protein